MTAYKLIPILAIALATTFTTSCKKGEGPEDPQPKPTANQPGSNEASGTERYNSLAFDEVSITRNIQYGSSKTQGGTTTALLIDIYEPAGDTEGNRPVVILAHGGGFLTGDKEAMEGEARYFARSGYVAASISYRLIDKDDSPVVRTQGVVDAVQDMKAAVRFFRRDAATNNNYRINSKRHSPNPPYV